MGYFSSEDDGGCAKARLLAEVGIPDVAANVDRGSDCDDCMELFLDDDFDCTDNLDGMHGVPSNGLLSEAACASACHDDVVFNTSSCGYAHNIDCTDCIDCMEVADCACPGNDGILSSLSYSACADCIEPLDDATATGQGIETDTEHQHSCAGADSDTEPIFAVLTCTNTLHDGLTSL